MIRDMPLERKALVLAEVAVASLSIYRVYDYVTTGFFVSDEYGYFYNAVHGLIYGGRWFFGLFNILLFRIPGAGSVDGFAVLLPFYLFFWSGLTVYIFYRTVKLIGLNQTGVALSLLSAFSLVSFVLLSLGFLTEPVGLALAMAGIYCLLRYYRSSTVRGRLLYPVGSAAFLGSAGGTREPYNALLLAGALLVVVIAVMERKEPNAGQYRKTSLALFSIALFIVPAGAFYYANSYATSQVPLLGEQIGHSIVSNPPIATRTTLTETSTGNVTEVVTTTQVHTLVTTVTTSTVQTTLTTVETTLTTVGTTLTTVGTITTAITKVVPQTTVSTTETTITTGLTTTYVTTSTMVVTTEPNYPFYAKSLLLNAVAIFAGGLVLGWGPLAFLVGLAGFVLVVRSVVRTRDMLKVLILLVSLAALGSYFVVSYIFAPDPGYLSFQNYSTIIRFSDTALPAYFLLAPFFVAHLSSHKRALAFGTMVVIFLLVAVPAYEVYASSNLNYSAGNPFSLSYRSPAIQVRDYVSAHPGQEFEVVGIPYGWYFTPGVDSLANIGVYPLNSPSLTPPINYTQFVSYHWSTFYVYSPPGYVEVRSYAPYLYYLVSPGSNLTQTELPYHLVSSQVVISNPGFVLVEIRLGWNST